MVSCHAGKPVHEFVDSGSFLQVVERAVTRTLVPLKTHSPLTLPGMLSIAVHVLQSFMVVTCVVQFCWIAFYVGASWRAHLVRGQFLNLNGPWTPVDTPMLR